MSWADCGNDKDGRPIGYAFPAYCDHPGCEEKIHRGLDYACGTTHGEGGLHGEYGCDKYFCEKHRTFGKKDFLCLSCATQEIEDHKKAVEERRNRILQMIALRDEEKMRR